MSLKAKWITYAVSGLILTGAGLSLIGDAIVVKEASTTTGEWFWYGTLALVVFNAGLCVFGQGVVYRSRIVNDRSNNR